MDHAIYRGVDTTVGNNLCTKDFRPIEPYDANESDRVSLPEFYVFESVSRTVVIARH